MRMGRVPIGMRMRGSSGRCCVKAGDSRDFRSGPRYGGHELKIIVEVWDGEVQDVIKGHEGAAIEVEVRDYDVPAGFGDPESIGVDEQGYRYYRGTW